MDRTTTGVSVAVGALVTTALAVIGFGVARDQTTDKNPDGFYVMGGVVAFVALLVFFGYFVAPPFFRYVDSWRKGSLAKSRVRAAQASGSIVQLGIEQAIYRSKTDPERVSDVTETVRRLQLADTSLDFQVSTGIVEADPHPHHPKELYISLTRDGEPATWVVDEAGQVRLP